MNIIIITRGDLPVPATKGGAVETLTELFILQNEIYKFHELLIYSVYDATKILTEKQFKKAKFINIQTKSISYKITNLWKRLQTKISTKYYGNEYIHRIVKDLKKHPCDYIMIENMPAYSIIIKNKFPQIPIIQHLHNSYITKNSPYKIDLLKTNNFIFGVSNFIKREVEAVYQQTGLGKGRVYTWYNAIDETLFKPFKDKEQLKKEIGFSPNDFVILYSGRIVEAKGVDKLLEAMKLLVKYQNIKLLILGDSSFANSSPTPFSNHIKELCNASSSQIKFTGYINYKQIYKYYSLADICIVPSMWNEPFALTALEAMTMGKPTIVTKAGGLTEVVDEKCAFIIDRNEELINNIAKYVETLYKDAQLREIMGIAAKERAKLFNSECFYKRFNELLKTIA